MAEELNNVLVIDIGSNSIKVGLAGDDAPTLVIPTAVNAPKDDQGVRQYTHAQFGNDAISNIGSKDLQSPIEKGVITNWDDMEAFFQYIFDEFPPPQGEVYHVLFGERPGQKARNRAQLIELMFERFDVAAVGIHNQAVLSLCASGRVTGLVLESGHDVTYTVPIHNGITFVKGIRRCDFAGRWVTDYLRKRLIERGYGSTVFHGDKIVNDIKETMCYVAQDFNAELKYDEGNPCTETYKLPDGSVIGIGRERFECGEILFKPSLVGHVGGGVHDTLFKCSNQFNTHFRRLLCTNIVLGGGTTMLKGFTTRLEKEMTALDSGITSTCIIAPAKRKYSAWVGGSIMAEAAKHNNWWRRWIDDYDEYGPNHIENPRLRYRQGRWFNRTTWQEGLNRTSIPVWDIEWMADRGLLT